MWKVVRLELRKHKQTITSVALMLVLSLLITAAITLFFGEYREDAFLAVSALIVALALPSLTIFLGAAFAVNLRHEPQTSMELTLPVSPRCRVFGSYAASLMTLLAFALALAVYSGACFLISEKTKIVVQALISWMPLTVDPPIVPHICLFLILVHVSVFLVSYWMNQPVMGAGLGVALPAITLGLSSALLGAMDQFLIFAPWWVHRYEFIGAGILSFYLFIVCLNQVACRIERGGPTGLRTLLRLFVYWLATLVLIPLVVLLVICPNLKRLTKELFPVVDHPNVLDSRAFPVSGMFLQSFSRDVIHLNEHGHRQWIYRTRSQISWPSLLFQSHIDSTWIDAKTGLGRVFLMQNGSLCGITRSDLDGRYDVYMSESGEPMKLRWRLKSPQVHPFRMESIDGRNILYGSTSRAWHVAVLSGGETEPHWIEQSAERWKMTRGAVLSEDKKSLTHLLTDGTKRTWTLPGEGSSWNDPFLAADFGQSDGQGFSLPVASEGRTRIAVCLPSGDVIFPWRYEWKHDWSSFQQYSYPIPGGGTVWVVDGSSEKSWVLFVLGPDGKSFPEIFVERFPSGPEAFYPRISVRKLEGSNLWLLSIDKTLYDIDLNRGQVLREFSLPSHQTDSGCQPWERFSVYDVPTKEGVYYLDRNQIHLLDWEGKDRFLGYATLEK